MIERVCVYCASSEKVDPEYFKAAEIMGRELVSHGITTVYGGGGLGLMGKLADTVIKEGGHIIGIMPEFMTEMEWVHKKLTQLILVKDLHERKKKLIEKVDAVVVLPGGCGTLEELFETITLKRLGLFTSPIILVNIKNYFKPLVEMLELCVKERFMREKHREMWTIVNEPEEVINAIHDSPKWEPSAIRFAAV